MNNHTSSSIEITKRTDRTLITTILYALLKPFNKHLGRPSKYFPAGSPRLSPSSSAAKKCDIQERKVDEIWIYDLTLKTGSIRKAREPKNKYRIYYFAGGGWQSPPSHSHWKFFIALLEKLPDATFSVISFPLAPYSPAPVAFPQLLKLYDTLLSQAAKDAEIVTLMGDSAGGNIVLCLPLEALRLDPKSPRPTSVMAVCPSTDLRRGNDKMHVIKKLDPVLRMPFIKSTADTWRGDWDAFDPRVSPLLSEHLEVFRNADVKVDGTTAGYDLLGPDGVLFRDKLEKAGVEGRWLDWDKMMHCWPLTKAYGISPEASEAFDWIIDVLRTRSEE